MEIMTSELTITPGAIGMMGGMDMLKPGFIEDAVIVSKEQEEHLNFIESDTPGITLEELERNCVIPSLGDNQLTISHQTFIHWIEDTARSYFMDENTGNIEIRASHKILGGVLSALTKRKEELKPEDEIIYHQRVAFCFHIRTMSRMMNGEEIYLCVGSVRSPNEENLYNRRSPKKFRISIGWRVCVCSDLMLINDGLIRRLEVISDTGIYNPAFRLFQDLNSEHSLRLLENSGRTKISQEQFCQIIRRLRSYQVLPASQLRELPKVILSDSNINTVIKDYVGNPNLESRGREDTSRWDLTQLLNGVVKQSYIDKFLERNQNCTNLTVGVQEVLNGENTENYGWFLSQTRKQTNSQERKV